LDQNESPHITGRQIEEAAHAASLDPGVAAHIRDCSDCADAIEMLRLASKTRSNPLAVSGRTPQCPDARDLARFLAHAIEPKFAREIQEHISQCEDCGRLVEAMTDVETRTDEKALVQTLDTSRNEWLEKTAVEFSRQGARRRASRPVLWGAIAAGLIAVLGGSAWVVWQHQNAPDRLLARAYTASRPFDFRLPDDGYSEMHVQRGAQSSPPLPLLEADVKIQQGLQKQPNDPKLLALEGRTQLLKGQYADAIESLDRAREQQPNDPLLLNDLACAIALRAQAEHRDIDYARAVQLWIQAQKLAGPQPYLLFNLATSYEKMRLVDQAIAAWQAFLRAEPSAKWRAEASEHLKHQQEELEHKKNGAAVPDASRFLATAAAVAEPEAYLDPFWTRWLPHLNDSPVNGEAATALAKKIERATGDRWLVDAVGAARLAMPAVVASLSQAIESNVANQSDDALAHARDVSRRLASGAAPVLRLRAEVEEIHALQRAEQYRECRDAGRSLDPQLAARGYVWMREQAALDTGACEDMLGNFAGHTQIAQAVEEARLGGYPLLALRGLGLMAASERASGAFGAVWQHAASGLDEYWRTDAAPIRAHQFLFDLSESARVLGWNDIAVVYGRAMVDTAERMDAPVVRALGRSNLAELLADAGEQESGLAELRTAQRQFALLPPAPIVMTYQLEAGVSRANLELDQRNFTSALSDLRAVQPRVATLSALAQRNYKSALARAYLGSGDTASAHAALTDAIAFNQHLISSLGTVSARLAAIAGSRPIYAAMARLQLEGNDVAGSLSTWEEFRRSPYEPARIDSSVTFTPASLPSGAVALVYADLDGRLAGWLVDRDGLDGKFLDADASQIRAVAERFSRLCARPSSDPAAIRSDARTLYDALIAPFEGRAVKARSWMLSPDGWISVIPLHALVDPAGKFVAAERETRIVSFLAAPRRSSTAESDPSQWRAVVVAAPEGADVAGVHLPQIEEVRAEADFVSSQFVHARKIVSPQDVDPLLDIARGAELFHFAGHGWTNAGNGALVLGHAAEGFPIQIAAADIARTGWKRCRLAVLSACMTAAGEQSGPVNPESLVRSFLAAGAERVIAAQWNVDSAATQQFMRAFYTSLRSRKTPEASMAEAARSMIARSPHPYYWAAFQLFENL